MLFLSGCAKNAELSGEIEGLTYSHRIPLEYAEEFTIDCYEGGYRLLTIQKKDQILVVPESMEVPENLSKDIIVVEQPAQNIYLVASSVMNIFAELDALDTIRLSGQKADGWHVEEAKKAMEDGEILYAGKYSQPDYELILSENCSLAIENTMISHTPEVKEKLMDFGIPVMVDASSYETHPLGRVEWVKLYGALIGKEELADRIFKEQLQLVKKLQNSNDTGKTAAFFFITSNRMVQIRQGNDYVANMIELAGGKYIFKDFLEEDSNRATLNIQMEEFYMAAKDADYLIYNSTIDGEMMTLDALLEKGPWLKDFKAVNEGNVYCTSNDMYQQPMTTAYMIEDFRNLFTDNTKDMTYLFHLE